MKVIKYKNYFIFLLFIFLFPISANSAAWLQKEGQGQVINSVFVYTTKSSFDNNGNKTSQKRFTKIEDQLYAEYGLTKDITIGANPSFQYLERDENIGETKNHGLADTEVFVRGKVWNNDKSVLSIQPLIKIPGPYEENEPLPLGRKQFDAEIRGLFGHGFELYGNNHFVNAELAYRKKMEAPGDDVRFDLTLGIRPEEKTIIMLQAFNTFSVNSSGSAAPFQISSPTDYDLTKLQISGVLEVYKGVSLQIGAFQNFHGKNTGSGGGGMASVWVNF